MGDQNITVAHAKQESLFTNSTGTINYLNGNLKMKIIISKRKDVRSDKIR